MSLTCVNMSEDVWLTCLTHALSTETEEIMGLLLGDIEYSENASATAMIWGASPQQRSDRQKDRVETDPEQLAAAAALADRMTISTGRTTRVIGWYHSHPHITVLPSHVDVRTQAMYQLLDSGFIGLIFSCFSEDASKVGRIQVIAFQSSAGKPNTSPKSMSPILANKDSVIYGSACEIDPMDESMQEAMLRSSLETSGAEYVRKEVPLHVLPTSSFLQLSSPLASFKDLQRVLYEEERAAYHQSLQQSMRAGKVDPLIFIHNTSTYQASLCKLMEYCLSPAINALQDRVRENKIRLAMLMEEAEVLEAQKLKGADTSGGPSRLVQSAGRRRRKRS
ncbi:hypothetical protein AALP_AA6G228600 [Arabis alpina]|uniref:MPN domain-containing protein n=1 Tax=Arabis alpina TaxID=50452 RepID=A0A087GR35_ARAAL|nr:hypothetical protein AALP_AA6G228600 [Arabis alpina]